jgi:hypothetical protein
VHRHAAAVTDVAYVGGTILLFEVMVLFRRMSEKTIESCKISLTFRTRRA